MSPHSADTPIDALAVAVTAVAELWPGGRIEGTAGAQLVALNDRLGTARRLLDAAAAQVASEISRQSRPELGADSLAKKHGYRNTTTLLATTLGTTNGEAAKLVQVGDATAPRVLLTGQVAPAKHPHVGDALAAGRIGTAAASAIVSMLDRVAVRAGGDAVLDAERILAGQAPGLSLDQLNRLIARAEAYLDPDGVQPREDELRAQTALRIRQDRSGLIHLTGVFDPETGAPIVTALTAWVGARLDAQRDPHPEQDAAAAQRIEVDDIALDGAPADGGGLAPRQPIPVLQAEALSAICAHLIGCDQRDMPLRGATVVVRVALDDLTAGTGHATIDGIDHPVSISTARRMAADAGVIPCVLGGESEILDWGRQKRLFTQPQRLAITERDGACVGCGAPPGHTRVHHIAWWSHGGRTDLSNGVLLCDSCHHLIHDHGWEVRVDGPGLDAGVWLIPPAHIDPRRAPRLAGRHRYQYRPAA